VSICVLLGAFAIVHLGSLGRAEPARRTLDAFPDAFGGWEAREGAFLEPAVLQALQPTDYLLRRDQDPDGRSVWLYIGYWGSQRRGAKPHSPKDCLPAGGWEPLEASTVTIALPPPFGEIAVNRYLVQKHRDQQLVLYWYQTQGKAIAGEMTAKIEMVKSSVARGRADGALVRVSSPVHGEINETSDRLVRYIRAMYPFLGEFVPN
jgi:EpsI family protein